MSAEVLENGFGSLELAERMFDAQLPGAGAADKQLAVRILNGLESL